MRRASQLHKETSASTRLQPRARDEKKVTDKKSDEMEAKAAPTEDVYEFKASKEPEKSPADKAEAAEPESETPAGETPTTQPSEAETAKRNFSEVADDNNDASPSNDEESRRKKRKDSDAKEVKTAGATARSSTNTVKGQNAKTSTTANKTTPAVNNKDRKSPADSPKAASDAEEDGKTDLKVPPLKIVIPQSTNQEQESGQTRNGKNNSQRSHAALPYVVPSSNDGEKETNSGNNSPTENITCKEEKKESAGSNGEEKAHQRVLRSSHRGGQADRSNNSSPQLQRSHSPSPSASPAAPTQEVPAVTTQGATTATNKSSDSQASNNSDTEPSTSSSNSNSGNNNAAPVELHPRKRKMKPSKEPAAPATSDALEAPAVSEVHPHEQPITNCYQLFLNIRKQIDKRRKGLFPVQPKPPQGFKDYLMNRGTYVLAGRAPTTPNITYPATLAAPMKDLFSDQEKERYKLRMQHVIEKEKLVLSVEQEILRVHGRAARALANQSLPFSVCTILRDEEVYNLITPEQEEKDRNARSRYNGRLFLSWLQDVDDKWEKIKEHMLLRHHNEAESLYAVQKMDWEWKLKELNLCDAKSTPNIDDLHVPMVHVSDDFDLLPA
ncbi:ankyrin repeat domain-containing protein 12 isoform X2 [Atheta coriaria]|uniref:ankyrin repeat domain-containing protein 12 isoform X2 n=1 Tax=Dalotia coriaria TaxID=877792 RepID=UPI0031F380A9